MTSRECSLCCLSEAGERAFDVAGQSCLEPKKREKRRFEECKFARTTTALVGTLEEEYMLYSRMQLLVFTKGVRGPAPCVDGCLG